MKDKKHIDRLFQEKLKNFDATPNDAVWGRISAQLGADGGQSKAMPIWWRIGGIAAGLLLLIGIGYTIINNSTTNPVDIPTEIVDTNTATEGESTMDDAQNKETTNTDDIGIQDAKEDVLNNNLVPQNQIATTQEEASEKGGVLNDSETISNTDNKNKTASDKAGFANADQLNKNKPKLGKTAGALKVKDNSTNTGVARQEQVRTDNDPSAVNTVSEAVAINTNTENLPEQSLEKDNIIHGTKEVSSKPSIPKSIAVTDISSGDEKEKNTRDEKEVVSKPSIPKGVAITDISAEGEKEDINKITEEASPSIEDAVASSEDGEDYDEKEKEVIDRWSVTPNVSPVYYNTLGSGSSINEQFNNNSKSGQLNMSYGVKAGYAITDKLSIRSGVNMINVGYNTNDVIIYQSLGTADNSPPLAPNSQALRNIDLKEEVQGITIFSGESLAFAQVPSVVADNLQSSLDQEITYIEVPLEMEYKISDKKLDVSLIGGFSTLFLTENNVYADFNEERTLLGEANNIKNVSYSANFGIGLGVKVSEKINLNFEPNFKYQINAFNNTSGNFKPYILGVNTGLKFKF
jgi:hypothetical protein